MSQRYAGENAWNSGARRPEGCWFSIRGTLPAPPFRAQSGEPRRSDQLAPPGCSAPPRIQAHYVTFTARQARLFPPRAARSRWRPEPNGVTLSVLRRSANFPVRIARTVLVVFGPLMLAIAGIIAFGPISDSDGLAKVLVMMSVIWVMCALALVPALLFNEAQSPPGSAGEDDHGGSGPPPEPTTPSTNGGGIPLPDADQSRERIRDGVRRRRVRARRRSVEREPGPVRK